MSAVLQPEPAHIYSQESTAMDKEIIPKSMFTLNRSEPEISPAVFKPACSQVNVRGTTILVDRMFLF